jgi:membrane protease YdiL (CAAX protease family)
MQDNIEQNIPALEKPSGLPLAQKILLLVFLVVYPVLQCVMNYLSPASAEVVESRFLELYLPSILLQILVFLSIIMALISNRESIKGLGIKPSDFSWINLGIGVGFLIVAIIVLNIIAKVLVYYGLYNTTDLTYLLPKTFGERFVWLLLAISAGISEEICFRGFVISRMTRLTGSLWPGVVIGSLAFGISHSYQGIGGMIIISVYGLMFALVFLARGSLVPCMIAHALQDIIAGFGT